MVSEGDTPMFRDNPFHERYRTVSVRPNTCYGAMGKKWARRPSSPVADKFLQRLRPTASAKVRVSQSMSSSSRSPKRKWRHEVEWQLPITGNTNCKLGELTLEALDRLAFIAKDIDQIREDLHGKPGILDVRTLQDGRFAIWFAGTLQVYEAVQDRLTKLRARVKAESSDDFEAASLTPTMRDSRESQDVGQHVSSQWADLWDDFEETAMKSNMVECRALQFENPPEDPMEDSTDDDNLQDIAFQADDIPDSDRSWSYIDDDGEIQGPFTSEEMREWYMDGFLPDDLLVCCSRANEPPPPLRSFVTLEENFLL